MLNFLRRGGLLCILLLISLSCQGSPEPAAEPPDPSSTPTTAAAASDPSATPALATADPTAVSPTETPPPASTPISLQISLPTIEDDEANTEFTLEEPLAVSYFELIEQGVEAELWTPVAGTIEVLRFFVGESNTLPFNLETLESSASGLLRFAVELRDDPATTPADKAEIERLFSLIVPSQAVLDAISEPASDQESSDPKSGRAKLAQQSSACADLAAAGYNPAEVTLGEFTCFKYKESEVNGENQRVY